MAGLRTDILVSANQRIYLFQKMFDLALQPIETPRLNAFGVRHQGPHLMSNDGFLDDTLNNRKWWHYGDQWPGWLYGTQGAKQGRILVFDDQRTYAANTWPASSGRFGSYAPGDQTRLVCDANANLARSQAEFEEGEASQAKAGMLGRRDPPLWQQMVPMIVDAMVLARAAEGTGRTLFVAGTKDEDRKDDLLAPFEGRSGGLLLAVSPADGRQLAQLDLPAPPVFDGMAAADGRLFLSTRDGRLSCFAPKPKHL
jgi:hypothetical protein